jgi:tetratricopeptide (TPR) repeat protein
MIKMREESRLGLGQCYNTAGEISLELERSTEALQYFELSCDIFDEEEVESISDEIGAAEWKSKARSGRGFAHWQLAVADLRRKYTDSAQRNLKDALRDLDWAAEYATETDRPAILNRRGEVHFWIKNYQAARDDWQKSLREAKKIGDAFNEFLSLGNLVRLAFYVQLEKFPTLYAFEQRYIEYQSRYQIQFDLLLGLFRTYLGHLALKQEDISKASVSYEEGLPLLAQVGMYDPFNLSGQLDFIESEVLPNIPSTLTHQIGEVLEKKWDVESHGVWASTYFRRWSHWSEQIE